MATLIELIAFFGLITIAILAWKKHRSYDLKQDEMNPTVKRKYQ